VDVSAPRSMKIAATCESNMNCDTKSAMKASNALCAPLKEHAVFSAV
jgi:hypothetical protein